MSTVSTRHVLDEEGFERLTALLDDPEIEQTPSLRSLARRREADHGRRRTVMDSTPRNAQSRGGAVSERLRAASLAEGSDDDVIEKGRPILVVIFIATMLLPMQIQIGSIAVPPYRFALLVLFIPLALM